MVPPTYGTAYFLHPSRNAKAFFIKRFINRIGRACLIVLVSGSGDHVGDVSGLHIVTL